MVCAIAPPGIRHSLTFIRLSQRFSLHTPKSSSSLGFHILKSHSSLQINEQPTHQSSYHSPPPHSSTLYSDYSTHAAPKTSKPNGTGDRELRAVLELATNSELFELEDILFGTSYFSPLLKSVSSGVELDRFMIEEDIEERQQFIDVLESRFLYLAADARSTLRGWRPSYKNVLLDMRKQLKVPCSTKLSAEDLEVEIFIHLIRECSRDWNTAAAVRVGAAELCSLLLKGGQLVSLLKISQMVSTRLSGKVLLEAVRHKIDGEVIKKCFLDTGNIAGNGCSPAMRHSEEEGTTVVYQVRPCVVVIVSGHLRDLLELQHDIWEFAAFHLSWVLCCGAHYWQTS